MKKESYIFKYLILIFTIFFCNELTDVEVKNNLKNLKIYESNLNNEIEEIYFCKIDNDRIIMKDEKGYIFTSLNYGKTWNQINESLLTIQGFKEVKIKEIYQNPLNNDNLIFINLNDVAIVTRNCGVNFQVIKERKVKKIKFHPFNELNIGFLIEEHSVKSMYLSKDAGFNLNFLKSNIVNFDWLKYNDDKSDNIYNRIFYLIPNHDSNNLFVTDDFFKVEFLIKEKVENYKISKHFITIKLKENDKNDNSNYISSSFGNFYYFYPLFIDNEPSKLYESEFIESVEHIENYLITKGLINSIPLNNLYMTNNSFYQFETIVENLVCNLENNKCDLFFDKSLEGILILNTYDNNFINKVKLNSHSYNSEFLKLLDNLDNNITSYISFDYGKSFNKIHYNDLLKNENSNVNLFINSDKDVQGIISSKTVPGLYVGLGNIGKFLDIKKIGVLISRDGGVIWEKVLDGNHVIEVVNNGGFILAAKKDEYVRRIKYSHDYGKNWYDIIISNELLKINSFKIEKTKKDIKLIIIGYDKDIKIITTVDFEDYIEKVCIFDKDEELSDFEEFKPTGYFKKSNNNCFNGRNIVYYRKKQYVLCYNSNKFSLKKTLNYCACSENDWHCDFGFYKNDLNECIKDKNKNYKNNPVLLSDTKKNCNKYFYDNKGYIKNMYSYCKGGVIHKSIKKECKYLDVEINENYHYSLLLIISVLILFFIFLGFVNFNKEKKNLKFNNLKENELIVANKINNNNQFFKV